MKTLIVATLASSIFFLSCKKDNAVQIPDRQFTLSTDSLIMLPSTIPGHIYNDMTFVNATTGYAVSRDGRIIKTVDGGLRWTELVSNVTFYLKRIQFVNNQTGYIIGGDSSGSYLLKTQDGGSSWVKSNLNNPEAGWPEGMFFLNENTGFINGKNYFKKTVNGGATWSNAIDSTTQNFTDVSFKTNKEGFATTWSGKYYKTTDGGITWQAAQSDVNETLKEICHSTSKSYAISGTNLVELQSGKASSSKLPTGIRRLLFLNDMKCVAIGQHYETGFFPYGDIHLTNSGWTSSIKKSYQPYTESLDFTAIAKKTDGKVLMLGTATQNTPVVELKY